MFAPCRIAKMKDGSAHLAHKAEHAVDLDIGAVAAVTLQGADMGDTTTLDETLSEAGIAPASWWGGDLLSLPRIWWRHSQLLLPSIAHALSLPCAHCTNTPLWIFYSVICPVSGLTPEVATVPSAVFILSPINSEKGGFTIA
jgi:hypothetical protein